MTYSAGDSLRIETTALVAMALMKTEGMSTMTREALTWISRAKDPHGTWQTTQATILAMRTLLKGTRIDLGADVTTSVQVLLNGKEVQTISINKDNRDVMRLISLTPHLRPGSNQIELRQQPPGELSFQLTGAYWQPKETDVVVSTQQKKPLQITTHYDRTTLAVNDELKCRVEVLNHTGQGIMMAMVDLGIPPGFDVIPDAFQQLLAEGRIAKFEITGVQVILYLRELSSEKPMHIEYSLRAKYPLRVKSPVATVYPYYNPSNRATSAPVQIEVK
jgi:uncharacterized protein YfaS (alpha-2-macroglobulin family)